MRNRKGEYDEGSEELNPKWTPTLERDPRTRRWNPMAPNSGQRVIGKRIARDENGQWAGSNEVSTPHIQYERWIDSTGSASPLVVGCSRNPNGYNPRNAERQRQAMFNAGGFPFDFEDAQRWGVTEGCSESEWPALRDRMAQELKRRYSLEQSKYKDIGLTPLEKMALRGDVQLTQPKRGRKGKALE